MLFSNGLATLCLAFLAGRQQRQQQQEDTPIVMTMFFPISGCSRRTAFVSYEYHHQRSFPSSAVTLHQQKQRDNRAARNNPAIAINKKIVDLGRNKQWKEILKVYEEESNQLDNVNYATMMSQLGRIYSFDRRHALFLRFLDDLANKIEQRGFEWIGVREASNIIYAIGKLRLNNNTAKRIIKSLSKKDVAAKFVGQGNPHDISNAAWSFANLGVRAPFLFAEIDRRSKFLVKEGAPQAIANTAWACATLGFDAPNLFVEIDSHAEWLAKEGKPQEVANTAWACATLGFNAPILFAEIDLHAEWLVDEGNPQNIANTAWACATLGFNAPNLFVEIDRHAEWLVKEGTTQAVANTAWAFATLGLDAPDLFAEINLRAEWIFKEGTTQNVANTAWAFATLGLDAPNLFAEIDRHAEWLVKEGTPRSAANTAWACATLGFDAPKLFAEIDHHAEWFVDKGNYQDIANIGWSCATLKYYAPSLFAMIDYHAEWLVENGDTQAVANTAWACATLGFNASSLFAEIDRNAEWIVNKGDPQAIANTAWACATLGFDSLNLFTAIEASSDELLPKLTEQGVANICYAIAITGVSARFKGILAYLWDMIKHMPSWDGFNEKGLLQLGQAQLYAKLAGVDLAQAPDSLLVRIKRAMNGLAENKMNDSQRNIGNALHELGLSCDFEVSPMPNAELGPMLAIDVACNEHKIAIEYDGPFHFLKELGTGKVTSSENGPTKAKRRFLEQLGWRVINIDYRDWIAAERGRNEMPWLGEEIRSAGIVLSNC